jgi:hypothetical protein
LPVGEGSGFALGRPGEPVRVNGFNDVAEAWVKIGGNTA